MRISHRITLLVIFLIIGMIVNTFTGLKQMKKVGNEFRQVAQGDIALSEIMTEISHHQLEKGILFERLQRVAEEIAFENVAESRKMYLNDYIDVTKNGFDHLSGKIADKIIIGRKLLDHLLMMDFSDSKRDELNKVKGNLKLIETAHINYDQSVNTLIQLIKSQKLQISFEDITNLRREEGRLSQAIGDLLAQVQAFTRHSVSKAQEAEDVAADILMYTLFFTILIAMVVAIFLIISISSPLRNLVNAAGEIGKGNLKVHVEPSSNIEINELSKAFNTMTRELSKAKQELEEKNQALAKNLTLVEQQKIDLEKVNTELDNFVGTVSHDIRSPLTGISGYSTILENQYANQMDERAQRCIVGIAKGTQRVNDMIVDLLELTKITRVRNPYEMVKMDNLVDSIIDRLEFKINEHKVNIKIQDYLPTVFCDRIKMGEVFHNLITNAIKFTSKLEIQPVIEIGYEEKTGFYQFFVKDNGIGIAKEDQELVFDIFKRLETAKDYEGTGAGLSIVKTIIQEHKGQIWINSIVGQYTCFYFTISKALTNESDSPS